MFALEKRGYVKAGPWTPEAAFTHPEAGKKDSTQQAYPQVTQDAAPQRVHAQTGEHSFTFNLTQSCMYPPVRQLHREFLRAGANVMQTFTFYASDDKLENRGQSLKISVSTQW